MSLDELKKVAQDRSLPMDLAQKYLKLYVADIDWTEHITALWKNSISKNPNQDNPKIEDNNWKNTHFEIEMCGTGEKRLVPRLRWVDVGGKVRAQCVNQFLQTRASKN